jgi:uncharacterized sulfatase
MVHSSKSTNNLDTDIHNFHQLFQSKEFIDNTYPLLYKAERNDSLGKMFKPFNKAPNIVILIVEGLNDDFIHSYKGSVLMPFLNQLKDKSLYWNTCFTLGERSFAVVPSILGGLPYGQKGFTLLDKLPRHLSLVSILNTNNYYTSFFYGQGAWFHQKERFFKYNNIDLVFDNTKYASSYDKIIVGDDNFFWGYNDKYLFNQSLAVIDTLPNKSRLDIYFTGTSHSPFAISNESYYSSQLNKLTTADNQEFFTTYEKYLKSLLFVDDALEEFFTLYKTNEAYENTLFIITGDHPMTEIPIANSLKRYHVPLIIFSEKLKEAKVFSNPVSHLDVPETLLAFLQNYVSIIPSISTSLGDKLFVEHQNETKQFAFMDDNREIIDFYSNGYYLAGNQLFKVDSVLGIQNLEDTILKTSMIDAMNTIKNISLYTSVQNRIIPDSLFCKALKRDCIYSYEHTDTIKITSEYYNLTSTIKIPNVDLVFDISFAIDAISTQELSVVYQINDSKGNTLLWKNLGIDKEKPFFQAHEKLKSQASGDTVLYFKSYIWNKNKLDFTLSDIDILLYH